jgi:4-hydroxy-4-methyl-2-oxoglutarate aldolase
MRQSLIGKVFKRAGCVVSAEHVTRLRELGVATVAACLGEPVGRDQIVSRGRLTRICGSGVVAGPVVTAWNPGGNNTMIRFAIENCQEGDILVVTTPADGFAQWGDNASMWAKGRKLGAVVIDGSVRDTASVRQIGVPVWARTVDPRQALKESPGYVNAPIYIGSVLIRPGDLLVADDDAVMALRPGQVEPVLSLATLRAEQEAEVMRQGASGQTPDNLKKIFTGERIEKVDRVWTEKDGMGPI